MMTSDVPRRLIGRLDAAMLAAGSMIGPGLLVVPAESARLVFFLGSRAA